MPNGLSTLRIERVTLGDSGTVTCYAFNDRKHFASASAKLIVLPEGIRIFQYCLCSDPEKMYLLALLAFGYSF